MALFLFQILLLLGMVAASFYLLYRYATYGNSEPQEDAALNEAQSADHTVRTEDAAEPKEGEQDSIQKEQDGLLKVIHMEEPVRVQILGNSYLSPYHDRITIKSEGSFTVRCHTQEKVVEAGETWSITAEDLKKLWEHETSEKAGDDTCVATIEPENHRLLILPELVRGQTAPAYAGSFQIYLREGKLLLVNEVPLEEYLCSVVSSEMPSDYPAEALCAQAVCARTYAVHCMEREKNKNSVSDLDDSVSFQVYNNYERNEASVKAVRMTEGEILDCGEVLYYSTSCQTEGRTDLGTDEAFKEFLLIQPEEDAEYGSPWIRWSVSLKGQKILEQLQTLYGSRWDQLEQIQILERNPDGQVQKIRCSDGTHQLDIEGEYQIRKVLSVEDEMIHLRNGQNAAGMQLLPSAYFCVETTDQSRLPDEDASSGQNIPDEDIGECNPESGTENESEADAGSRDVIFEISGGGYGHGNGMSQYGAAAMAAAGTGYREILEFYYKSQSR